MQKLASFIWIKNISNLKNKNKQFLNSPFKSNFYFYTDEKINLIFEDLFMNILEYFSQGKSENELFKDSSSFSLEKDNPKITSKDKSISDISFIKFLKLIFQFYCNFNSIKNTQQTLNKSTNEIAYNLNFKNFNKFITDFSFPINPEEYKPFFRKL